MIRATALAICLLHGPSGALAQDTTPDSSREIEESLDLFSEGAKKFLEGLQQDLSPLLQQLEDRIDDLNAYEVPEFLPNGDILIRRKPEPAPETGPEQVPELGPDGEEPIEL